MSETNIAIKTLNGYPLADTEARAEIETIKETLNAAPGGNAGGGSSAPAPVVILPETTMEVDPETSVAHIDTPLHATPTSGATAKIVYNGAEYTCSVLFTVDNNGVAGYIAGNTQVIGYQGGNSDAPFAVILFPDGMDDGYGMVVPLDDSATVTISITQVASSSGGNAGVSELFNITATLEADNTISNISATYEETKTAFLSGKHVRLLLSQGSFFMAFPAVSISDDTDEGGSNRLIYFEQAMFATKMYYLISFNGRLNTMNFTVDNM